MDFKITDIGDTREGGFSYYYIGMPPLIVYATTVPCDGSPSFTFYAYVYPDTLENIPKLKLALQKAYEDGMTRQIAEDKRKAEKETKKKFYASFSGKII